MNEDEIYQPDVGETSLKRYSRLTDLKIFGYRPAFINFIAVIGIYVLVTYIQMLGVSMHQFDEDLAMRNRLVANLVSLLAAGKFEEVLRNAPGSRVSSEMLRKAVYEYGRTLVPLPTGNHELIDYIAVLGSSPLEWSVVVPLFTEEEGRSDLSLELSVIEQAAGGHRVEINNLHVL